MESPALSVIVPVYKAEKYLRKCVDSILAQTFKDFEVILVDDGSPDGSGAICDEYAKKDPRVRVFHKENGGVSSARQCGLNHARGEYTIHADPDDWVEPNMLEELYAKAKAEDADMVICDYYEELNPTSQRLCRQKPDSLNPRDVLRQLLFQQLHGSCCNKLVRRACYKTFDVRFPPQENHVILWEDLFICCDLLRHGIRVEYINKAYYHYDLYSNTGSMVRMPTLRSVLSQMYVIDYFESKIDGIEDALLGSKASTKELAFRTNLFTCKGVKELYPEVNDQYNVIRPVFKQGHLSLFSLSVLLAIHGCAVFAYLVNRIAILRLKMMLKIRVLKLRT